MGAVLGLGRAAGAGAGDGAYRDLAAAQAHEDLGAGANDLERAAVAIVRVGFHVQEEHEGRRVGAAERPVKGKGRQRKVQRPALRRHHLEDVARADVVPGAFDRRQVVGAGKVRLRLAHAAAVAQGAMLDRQVVKAAQRLHHPLGRLGIGRARGQAVVGPGGRAQRHLAFHAVQHRHDRRADQHRVGRADRVGVHVGQVFDQPDHVVAEIAVKPRRAGRNALGHVDPAFADQRPQAVERGPVVGLKRLRPQRPAVDAGAAVAAFPDQVGLHADHRIASALLAPGHAFQHEAVGLRGGEFQHQADRRVEIGGQADGDKLVAAARPARLERGEIGRQVHYWMRAFAAATAAEFTCTPRSACSARA